MKSHLFKFISCLLAAAMIFAIAAPLSQTQAAETKKSGDWEYQIDNGSAVITKYNGTKETVTLPSKLGGKKVTKIGNSAFEKNKYIETAKIGKTYTEIGKYAFSDCINLTKVVFAKKIKLKLIDSSAFSNCYSLAAFKIPATVTELGEGVFNSCKSLKSIVIPAKVTKIGKGLCQYCIYLEKAEIKGKITELPANTFWECYYLEDLKLPDTIKTIGNAALGCCNLIEKFTVPANTTTIEWHAFWGMQGLKELDLGSKTESISGELFRDCYNLEKITFPKSVKEIKDDIFSYMPNDTKNYLVIEAPKGSFAAKFFETDGFDVTYTK